MGLEEKKVKFLVVDTTAFIQNAQLQDVAEKAFTCQEVIDEVTNKRQRSHLFVLPYDLEVKQVYPENIKIVRDFSIKTGDYPTLSATDLAVMALTYQLEKEHVGIEHVRTEPVMRPTVKFVTKPVSAFSEADLHLPGFYMPGRKKKNVVDGESAGNRPDAEDQTESESAERSDNNSQCNEELSNPEEHQEEEEEEDYDYDEEEIYEDAESFDTNENLDDILAPVKTDVDTDTVNDVENRNDSCEEDNSTSVSSKGCDDSEKNDDDGWITPSYVKSGKRRGRHHEMVSKKAEEEEHVTIPCEEEEEPQDNDDEDDDDDGWITPSNSTERANQKTAGSATSQEDGAKEKHVTVACMTTDFAMQNVLKQMNLNVAALDGRMIKSLRTSLLRCYACFKTTSLMTKQFCPKCGNSTLKRVAASVDEEGKMQIHINVRRPLSGKGKKFSLPRIQGGKHPNNPRLVEDQPMAENRPSKKMLARINPLTHDYVEGYSPFVRRDTNSRSAHLGIKPGQEFKYWMKRNPNESCRRRK